MRQEFTSAGTSINSSKLPAIYRKVPYTDGTVLDYGCGRFFENYNLPENVKGFDPYNYPVTSNLERHYDKVFCSNVLNVIKEREIRLGLLETLKTLGSVVYITVYEGDGSGTGKVTKKDCYQLNRKARDYIGEISEIFETVEIKQGVIVAR